MFQKVTQTASERFLFLALSTRVLPFLVYFSTTNAPLPGALKQ